VKKCGLRGKFRLCPRRPYEQERIFSKKYGGGGGKWRKIFSDLLDRAILNYLTGGAAQDKKAEGGSHPRCDLFSLSRVNNSKDQDTHSEKWKDSKKSQKHGPDHNKPSETERNGVYFNACQPIDSGDRRRLKGGSKRE